ncbi:MAG: hypothetical protein U0414_44385 [Polyangiaceae bacterium]
MERFLPCPACDRLVLSTERACPFCAAPVGFPEPAPLPSDVGIARAARAVLGAAVVATLAACGDTGSESTAGGSAAPKSSGAPSAGVSAKPSATPSAVPSAAPSASDSAASSTSASAAPSASATPSATPTTAPPITSQRPTPTIVMPPYGAPPPRPIPKS